MTDPHVAGIPLSRYQILYHDAPAAVAAAAALQKHLRRLCGVALPLTTKGSKAPTIEIAPLHGTDSTATYGEGCLRTAEERVLIQGDDIIGLSAVSAHFAAACSAGTLTERELSFHTALPAREAYLADVTALCPPYLPVHHVPAERLTLASKRQALNDPHGRPFVIAHRGEHIYYPENSLESVISAWLCGADAAEIDIQKSADGVWVCMHDNDVTRTTNAAELLGANGFPTSPLLCDWTLAQLRALRLKDAYGQLTPFRIPTLREILQACDDRIYLHPDKAFSVAEDLFPLMEELDIYECVYLVNQVSIEDILTLKEHFAHRGVHLDSLPRPRRRFGQTPAMILPTILGALPHTTPAMIPIGDYVAMEKSDFDLIAQHCDTLRFGAWFLRDFDYEALWLQARARGISIFMTNHPLDIISLSL